MASTQLSLTLAGGKLFFVFGFIGPVMHTSQIARKCSLNCRTASPDQDGTSAGISGSTFERSPSKALTDAYAQPSKIPKLTKPNISAGNLQRQPSRGALTHGLSMPKCQHSMVSDPDCTYCASCAAQCCSGFPSDVCRSQHAAPQAHQTDCVLRFPTWMLHSMTSIEPNIIL